MSTDPAGPIPSPTLWTNMFFALFEMRRVKVYDRWQSAMGGRVDRRMARTHNAEIQCQSHPDRRRARDVQRRAALFPFLLLGCATAWTADIERVSVDSAGNAGNGASTQPAVSDDGAKVLFRSVATNLVADDTNGIADLFLHDRITGTTTRLSVSTEGEQANGSAFGCCRGSISADGKVAVFDSDSSSLVNDDTNGRFDVFVHELAAGATERVSIDSSGKQANQDSFTGGSQRSTISADGRFVVFHSTANNLVSGDTNAHSPGNPFSGSDIFLRDRLHGTTERISLDSAGNQMTAMPLSSSTPAADAPSISADGRYIAFSARAANMGAGNGNSHIYIHDRQTGQTSMADLSGSGQPGNKAAFGPALSADGSALVFTSLSDNLVADDTNDAADTFVRNRVTGATIRVSVASDGTQGNASSGTDASISADGRRVLFRSAASNLVANDTNRQADIFVHDLPSGRTIRINVSAAGKQANGFTAQGKISANGRWATFSSDADNLVANDTNGVADIFVVGVRPR